MKQHKWHKEIKAWADGAEIEMWYGDRWEQVHHIPEWNMEAEFRIKPQPKELDIKTALEIAHYTLKSVAKEYPVQEAVDACERALNIQPKEPKYLYVYIDNNPNDVFFTYDNNTEISYGLKYIGKIKLEESDNG